MDGNFGQTKKFVKNKNGNVVVGNSKNTLSIAGGIMASGTFVLQQAYTPPDAIRNKKSHKTLRTDGLEYSWKETPVECVLSQDNTSKFDYIYVDSSKGFYQGDKIIINPFGATRETGTLSYSKLETKLNLNSFPSHPHYKGERIIKC